MALRKDVFVLFLLLLPLTTRGQVTFVIDEMPKTTPPTDTIFISGTFNNWAIDPAYILQKRLDGKHAITITSNDSVFEYKFTRGSWLKAETDDHNGYITNRVHRTDGAETVHIAIGNWQDLGGAKPFEIISLYFFAISFLGMITVYFLSQIRNKRKRRIRFSSLFLMIVSFVLFGRVLLEMLPLRFHFPLGLAGELALLTAPPLFYFIFAAANGRKQFPLLHHLPAGILVVVIVLKLVNASFLNVLTRKISSHATVDDLLIWSAAIILSITYVALARKEFRRNREREDVHAVETRFFKALFYCALMYVLFLAAKSYVIFYGSAGSLLWYDRNAMMMMATAFTILISYFAFSHDEVFRQIPVMIKKADELAEIRNILDVAMREKRVYTNPHLTLNDLSEVVNIKPYVLSKVINECYHQNFRDFVNRYRIEEFIVLAKQESGKRLTFLALAFEVGFNSKSTFNIAFKKITNFTPREYFALQKDNALKDNEIGSINS
jgi:AraC-like DNA-binding protein